MSLNVAHAISLNVMLRNHPGQKIKITSLAALSTRVAEPGFVVNAACCSGWWVAGIGGKSGDRSRAYLLSMR